jgi:hypothetical protein
MSSRVPSPDCSSLESILDLMLRMLRRAQPVMDLRNPLDEDAHFRTQLTTRWVDDEDFEGFRPVRLQHHDQLTALDRRSHHEV